MTVTQYQAYDFHWDEAMGDPEGDPIDLHTRHYSSGWFKMMMREDRERQFYQPIVKCRMCLVNWAPAEFGRCYSRPSCRPWRNS